MSFSSGVKTDLAELNFGKKCCMRAEAYGILLFAKSFSYSSISLQTDNHAVAQRAANLIKRLCKVNVDITRGETGVYIVSVPDFDDRVKLLEYFGKSRLETVLRINRANIDDACDGCLKSFVRGCFLVCGSISDPAKSYHFEFNITRKKLAEDLVTLLYENSISPKTAARRNSTVVYFKKSEDIEDMLTFMGASNASLEIMSVKIYKDIKNRENRLSNCDVANLEKTAVAALRQCKAIEVIEKYASLETLSDDLKAVALLRKENPEMSLSEMGAALEPKLTRSGVNRRLDKLEAIAADLKQRYNKEGK